MLEIMGCFIFFPLGSLCCSHCSFVPYHQENGVVAYSSTLIGHSQDCKGRGEQVFSDCIHSVFWEFFTCLLLFFCCLLDTLHCSNLEMNHQLQTWIVCSPPSETCHQNIFLQLFILCHSAKCTSKCIALGFDAGLSLSYSHSSLFISLVLYQVLSLECLSQCSSKLPAAVFKWVADTDETQVNFVEWEVFRISKTEWRKEFFSY